MEYVLKMGSVISFRRKQQINVPLIIGIASAIAGIGIGVLSTLPFPQSASGAARYRDTITGCRVVDGDTLRCGAERVRLLGIDAPELPGHCAVGRDCASGDPFKSTQSLRTALGDGEESTIERVGWDRYGRTLAMVRGARGDLSCWQLAHGEAIYKPAWDNDGLVAATCPRNAR